MKEGPIGHRLHICLLHTSLGAPRSRLGLIEPLQHHNPQAGVGHPTSQRLDVVLKALPILLSRE